MWYSKQLRLVRRARKVAKTQQHQLLALELEGITALTLLETLRDRHRALQTEARQLRQDWRESESLRDQQQDTTHDLAHKAPAQ